MHPKTHTSFCYRCPHQRYTIRIALADNYPNLIIPCNMIIKLTTRFALFAALFNLALPSSAVAHAILVRSEPAKDSVVTVSPTKIDVWFDDKVGSEFKALAVIDSAGKRVDNKDVQQETFEPAHLYATLQPLAAGTYTTRYRVVSIDGHIVTGKFQFTVKAP